MAARPLPVRVLQATGRDEERLQPGEGWGCPVVAGGELWPTVGMVRVPAPPGPGHQLLVPFPAFTRPAPTSDARLEAGAWPDTCASRDTSLLAPGNGQRRGQSGTRWTQSKPQTQRQDGSMTKGVGSEVTGLRLAPGHGWPSVSSSCLSFLAGEQG